MTHDLSDSLIKLLVPLAAIGLALFLSKRRGLSLRDDLGLRAPRWPAAALWMGLWLAAIVLGEMAIEHFGLDQAKPWPPYPLSILLIRIAAIGIAGPVLEELIFRGILFDRLRRTRLGPVATIVVLALVWAGVHYSYGIGTIALVAIDGLLLGFARHRTNSLYVPMAMHVLGNLISIGQSLSG